MISLQGHRKVSKPALCGFRTQTSPIPTFTKRLKELESEGFISTILIDFSKAYDFLPRDLYNTQKKHL